MFLWVNIAFSVLFGLIEGGVIPADKYRAFRKLALKICMALPPADFDALVSEVKENDDKTTQG